MGKSGFSVRTLPDSGLPVACSIDTQRKDKGRNRGNVSHAFMGTLFIHLIHNVLSFTRVL